MAAAVRDFGQLESAGWKADRGTAIDGANAQGRFYRAMLAAMAQRGAASVYRYWLGERLVAMNLCVEDGNDMIILKTTYDETLDAHYTPAFLMLEEMCRQLLAEQRLGGIEFYGKVMDWHRRWSDDVRTLYHVNHYRVAGLASLHRLYGRWQQRQPADPSPAPIIPVTE
jgi:CelD/BcsL family acetyltransferase involved in cellulose biosynthesis